jgi:hypothetical protein
MFSAGCLGGVVNSLVVWLFGLKGITLALGVKIAPALTPPWLYGRVVWGGLWGFLFLAPLLKGSVLGRGFLMSLGPTIAQLLWVFPYQAKKGPLGLDLGTLTPLFVIFFNWIWGAAAAAWMRIAEGKG